MNLQGVEMSIMIKCDNLREAKQIAREIVNDGGGFAITSYILKRNGDTVAVDIKKGRIRHRLIAGHVTLGMWIDSSDLPCIVYR